VIRLDGRAAIVTGAGAGLGRSYAHALAQRGARVLANDLGASLDGSGANASAADAVVTEIVAAGGDAVADHTSVASADGGEAIVAHALDAFGRIDILVNNAGNIRLSSFAKLDVRTIADVLDVHLGGAFYVTAPAWRAMSEQKYGRIVMTGSGLGAFGIYGASVYAAAKGGIAGLLTVLELESQRHGIRVNAVAPMANTRMGPDEIYAALPDGCVSPDLVAPVVVYLASDECAVNGEMWSAGAGSVARLFSGRTDGYFKHPRLDGPLTAEDIAVHTAEIIDMAHFTEPDDWPAEVEILAELYRARENA
jgi:NAD(P)-dependent dehydrogenase (short-subunit alcohol dehydrogenase family)